MAKTRIISRTNEINSRLKQKLDNWKNLISPRFEVSYDEVYSQFSTNKDYMKVKSIAQKVIHYLYSCGMVIKNIPKEVKAKYDDIYGLGIASSSSNYEDNESYNRDDFNEDELYSLDYDEFPVSNHFSVINKFDDSTMTDFLNIVSKYPLLSEVEEKELLNDYIKTKNKESKDKLVLHNLRLVVFHAKRYTNYGIPLIDLIHYGVIGLMTSIEKFDYKKGKKLSTYASIWIHQAITRNAFDNLRLIRIPSQASAQFYKNLVAAEELEEKIGRTPTIEELTKYINDNKIFATKETKRVSEESVANSFVYYNYELPSTDMKIKEGEEEGESTLGDFQHDEKVDIEDIIIKQNIKERINEILERELDPKSIEIIKMRYGLGDFIKPHTLQEVGDVLGITRERVRQIESLAMRKLKYDPLSRRDLRELL